MAYESPEERRAYIEGARAVLESAIASICPADARALEEWIDVDLANWTGGKPPLAPHEWV